MDIIFNNKVFKQYRDTIYYLSEDGEVYSSYCNRLIKGCARNYKSKHYYYIDVYSKEKHKQIHVALHKMVYIAWNGEIPEGEQVNHINDNALDNRLCNLYTGAQQQNIHDCMRNNHRVGNVKYFTVKDKKINKVLTFCPANTFIEYCGHPSGNGGIKRYFDKKWFKNRYEIIEFSQIEDLSAYQSVTTMGDECNPVGLNLSQAEAHCNSSKN